MKRVLILVGVLLCLLAFLAADQPAKSKVPDALMLRFPDVSADQIVFVYAGDLWIVPKEGGLARKLSSPKGFEFLPKFSPDGQMIAFSGNYDGNTDVYVMPAVGGSPKRLTHHPGGDGMVAWYPDGKNILFRSLMNSPSYRFRRLFKQSVRGGMPEMLPLPYGELASFSPDGKRMAFQYISRQGRTWKRYRGGLASDLWIYDFVKNTSEKITKFEGTDALPMWHENTIYFLSDRDKLKKGNIWAYDLDTKKFHQVTYFKEYDVKWPSIGPDSIIFENGGQLHLLDLKSEKSRPVSIQVPADLPSIRAQLKDCSKNIDNFSFSLSPSGKRALFGARGEIFTVPQKHGSVRNLTNTSGVAERYPAWSPDGKHVAYFSDRTGEYELYLRSGDGKGKERQITKGGSVYRFLPVWSPDSKKIAFLDKTSSLFVLDVEEGKPKFVDKDKVSYIFDYTWSPDNRWLAYTKRMNNGQGAIMIYDAENHKTHQVTSGYYYDFQPVFDPEGKYLFFYSNRALRPVYGDMDDTWVYPNATDLYALTLGKDVESPLAPRSDEEEVKEEKKEEKGEKGKEEKGQEKKEPAKKPEKEEEKEDKPKPVKIDFEGIEKRVIKLPAKLGNVGPLHAVKGKVVYSRYPATGAAERGVPSGTLAYYDLKEREEKTVMSGIDTYDLSADGKKVLYRSKTTWGIIDLAPKKKVGDGRIATNKMKAWINPRKEWKQLFNEAWRIERDFFYAPNMHGLDWKAIKKRYEAMLPYVVDRQDLNYVIGEMIAELNVSHSYIGGGDIEQPKRISVGLLGCDFELDRENNAFRIKKIYEGAVWDAPEASSPLMAPGVKVKEGEYLLAVNGLPLDTSRDVWASFQGLAGEVVTLAFNSTASMEGARDVIVKPLSSEYRLRNLAWIESNRKKVEKATNGRVGYVYVPDTSINGQNELLRQFIPQHRLDGLIIDERFNSGGQASDRFIEMMNRPIYVYAARREHRDLTIPYLTHVGPKVMIINEWAGSGGDAFPYFFRKAGLGPLIGKRTWGGLVGISGNPMFIDGGFITAPNLAIWHPDGYWDVEGYGVDPDIEVENVPHEMVAGKDAQLEKAIEVILEELKKNPPKKPKRPAYPDRSK